jgi:hypothetical protein
MGNDARSDDWIVVAPGDYHENADTTGSANVVSARRAERYIGKVGEG